MSTDDNKQLVRRLFEAIDTLSPTLHRDFFAPGYVDHTPCQSRTCRPASKAQSRSTR